MLNICMYIGGKGGVEEVAAEKGEQAPDGAPL